MDEKKAKNVVAMLRAVLMSSKEGVLATKVQGEYRGITGEFLPYKQLGFSSLDAYLQSIPDVVRIARNSYGEVVYHAVADASTLHIQRLKRGEKSNKKRKPSKGFKYNTQRRPTHTHHSYRKPPSPYFSRFHPSPRSFGARPSYSNHHQPYTSSVTWITGAPQPSKPAIGQFQGGRRNNFVVPPRFQKQMEGTQNTTNHVPTTVTGVPTVSSTGSMSVYKSQLNEHCQKSSIATPQYATTLELIPGKENRFISKVTVNGFIFKCSESMASKKDAEGAVAKMALERLGVDVKEVSDKAETKKLPCKETKKAPEQTKPSPTPVEPLPRNEEEEELANKIRLLLKNRPKGVWATRLPAEFKARFKEDFPEDVKDKLQRWPDVARADSSNGPVIFFPVQEEVPTREDNSKHQENSNNNNPHAQTNGNDFLEKMMNKFQHTERMAISIKGNGKEEEEPRKQGSLKSVVNVVVPPAELPDVGTKQQVFVSHFEGPELFYIHYTDSVVDNIQRIMAELYEDTRVGPPSSFSPGTSCAAKFTEDDLWCRAVLTLPPGGANSNKDLSHFVQYVDYGNTEFVGEERIQRLVVRAVQHPAQALPCQLHMVQSSANWSQAAKDRFSELTRDVELTMTVTAVETDRCTVRLQLPGGEDVTDRLAQEQLLSVPLPEAVDLPDDQFCGVYVVDCNNTTEVVIRIYEASYQEKLDQLVNEMTDYYNSSTRPAPDTVVEGFIYAAYTEPEGYWCRVQAVDVEDDNVKCYFLDFGDTDVLTVDKLRVLAPCYTTQPVNVLKVQLAGLQDFSTDSAVLQKLYDQVAGKCCIAEIKQRGPVPIVTFYDTHSEDDVNVNELCLSVVDARDLAPTIPEVGEKLDGYVTFVDSSGLLYFTSPGPGLDKLEELMSSADQHTSGAASTVTTPEVGTVYYSCFSQDQCWYRAEVTALLPQDKVAVHYIDFGNSETVDRSSLRNLQSCNPQLSCLPAQALKCRLAELPPEGGEWTQVAVDVLSRLCKDVDEEMICTIEPVEKVEKDGVLLVQMVLIGRDQECHVNRYLLEQPHLFSPPQPGAKSDRLNNNLSKSQPGSARTSPVPDVTQNLTKQACNSPVLDVIQNHKNPSRSASPSSSVSSCSEYISRCNGPVPPISESSARPGVPSNPEDRLNSVGTNAPSKEELSLANRIDQLSVQEDQGSNKTTTTHPSLSKVPTLSLPGKNHIMDVFIEDAMGPDHFILRPFETKEQVDKLAKDMEDFYEGNFSPMEEGSVKAGMLYAAFVEETQTYQRVCVRDIAQNGDVSVWGLDMGGYHVVSTLDLQILDPRFCVMPAQAMRGQLGGVVPIKGNKWSESSEEFFCRLVQKKAFVAKFLMTPGFTREKGHFRQVSLNVGLIDTSNEEKDVWVEDLLVMAGHATKVPPS